MIGSSSELGLRVSDPPDVAASAATVDLVTSLLTSAVEANASDLHLEPRRDDMVVRMRIDGVMRELMTIPKDMVGAVASHLKLMGELDPADRRSPQEGRASACFGGRPIELRIATLPTTHGEQIVLRIVGGGGERSHTLAALEMDPEAEEALRTAIEQPYGQVIVCGPRGSGKTTTLYAALEHLNDSGRVLMTIEDPVEYQLEGVNQIQVDEKAGLSFESGLRTILRSDPDVLLIGEIADPATASIATHAAMTGELVLTSLHAHNAASAIARLREMGVDPTLIAGTLNCVVAQRLARRLCLNCRQPYAATADQLGPTRRMADQNELTLYSAVGCADCHGTGYAGRVALREVMPVQGEVRALVERSTEEIFAAAVRYGMTTLRDDGIRVALAGVSSVEEIGRVTGIRLT